jgi:hypothetical protein
LPLRTLRERLRLEDVAVRVERVDAIRISGLERRRTRSRDPATP